MGETFSSHDDKAEDVKPPTKSHQQQHLPAAGKQIAVTAVQGDLRCRVEVTSEWKGENLLQELEKRLNIHSALMKVRYGARPLGPEQRIASLLECEQSPEQLPESVNLQLHVDRRSFPEMLGPFSICDVPLEAVDFQRCEWREGGWTWEMSDSAFHQWFPKNNLGSVRTLVGYASPVSSVALGAAARQADGIPDSAAFVAWSYPLDKSEVPSEDVATLEQKYEKEWFPESCQTVKTFLSAGGFMYFDKDCKVVKVTTIGQWREGCDKGGLHFGAKELWNPAWMLPLREDARFQKNTLQGLKNMRAKEFCWLCPNEVINGVPVPNIPYGGFAYLFEASPWLDCYFPVVAPPEGASGERPFLIAPHAIAGEEDDTDVAPPLSRANSEQNLQSLKFEKLVETPRGGKYYRA